MKRLLSPVVVLALLLLSTSCRDLFVRGAIEPGSTIEGSVSIVQIETEGTLQVTFVTLLQNGTSSTIGFCGDQSAPFPLHHSVRVNFNPGKPLRDRRRCGYRCLRLQTYPSGTSARKTVARGWRWILEETGREALAILTKAAGSFTVTNAGHTESAEWRC